MNVKKWIAKLFPLPLSLALSGCLGYITREGSYTGPKKRPESVDVYFSYSHEPINPFIEVTKVSDNYTVKRITFPTAMHTKPENDTVTVDYYDVNGDQKTPLIIVSPILGGKNTLTEFFAEYFADRGFSSALVHRPKDKIPDSNNYAQGLEDILKQSLIDTRRVIDLLESFPDIDANKIGSFGISLGAIKNSTLAGIDSRLKVNVFALGGADIPHILERSREGGIVEQLKQVKDKQQLFSQLREVVRSDPKYLAPYIDGEKALLFIGMFDNVVPVSNQKLLRDLIGKPSVCYLLSGHYSALFYTLPPFNVVQRVSYNFFKQKFAELDQ
ncbi:hypothetical protein HY837_06425 [archaeon]|nr:hypothetical protein [archaeon]